MNSSQSLKVVTMLMTVFDVPAWTDERRDAFQRAIEDLPYESGRTAAATWIRQQTRRPEPADIRRLAEATPISRGLPPPEGTWTPRYHTGDPRIFRMRSRDVESMIEFYARNAGGRLDRPDLAHAARQLRRPDLEQAFLPEYDVQTSVVYGSVPEHQRHEYARLALQLTVAIAQSGRAPDSERREMLERIAWMHDRWPGLGWDTVYAERSRSWGLCDDDGDAPVLRAHDVQEQREWYP